jgi:COMPASS component SWD1
MNAELLDPFAQDYPEALTASFNFGHATCLRFNHSGSHVGVGLVDGAVIIWDTATSSVARVLKAHTRTVQSLWYFYTSGQLLRILKLVK